MRPSGQHREQVAYAGDGGAPPIERVLFGPAGWELCCAERVFLVSRRDDCAVCAHGLHTHTLCAQVDANDDFHVYFL